MIEAVQVEAATGIPNVFRLKAVSDIKRLFGSKPISSTMKEERPAYITNILPNIYFVNSISC